MRLNKSVFKNNKIELNSGKGYPPNEKHLSQAKYNSFEYCFGTQKGKNDATIFLSLMN